jgi:ankyrin repeat protein
MFKELLDHGPDPNLAGSVAVVSAAAGGNIKAIPTLINRGANIHEQEGVPGKALHLAARNLQTDMVKLLLKHGVDANSFGGKYG